MAEEQPKPKPKPTMQPLPTTRRVLMWLSMCTLDESTDAPQRRAYTVHTWAVLIINLICFTASLTFCVEFIKTDFESSTFAFMVASADSGMIYIFITAIHMRLQIDEIFNGLWTIYRSCELKSVEMFKIRSFFH